jgi:hypothetical protein
MATTATVMTAGSAVQPRAQDVGLSVKDKVTIGLIGFFILVAWTLEAYWLLHNNDMEAHNDIFQKGLALYWPADRTYRVPGHDTAKSFTLALESVNVCVTQLLSIWLLFAIVRRRHYRHVLQLVLATYTWYGTFLYYYVAQISGFAIFEYRGTYPFVMFYVCNAPWFIGYAWMAYESVRAISARLRAGAAG